MGIYLNPGNAKYSELCKLEKKVDKSCLIEKINKILNTPSKYICISRPKKFGKSTDANMLVAYYSKGCDSSKLFKNLKIEKKVSENKCDNSKEFYENNLNKHHVIYLNMQDFLSMSTSVDEMINLLTEEVTCELLEVFPLRETKKFLSLTLSNIFARCESKFIFIIDDWDCVIREFKEDEISQKKYLVFLRNLLKDKPYVELCYMTGVLPIKKYGTQRSLDMFNEVMMLQPDDYVEFMGFTDSEIDELLKDVGTNIIDKEKLKRWYGGYCLNENIYSPYSVISCIKSKNFREYSVLTETLQAYINLDFPGLKEDIIAMLVGEKRKVNVRTFQNDLMSFNTKDDVLTLLIHLGYLGYDSNKREVSIPNTEVRNIFIDAIIISDWNKVTLIFKNADELLEATGEKEENKVKKYIQDAHYETSKLKYDDVNALLYTIKLAYITAMKDYTIIENLSSDEKIVDVLFIPKNNDSTKSAMNIEFKDENVTDTIINKDTITNTEKIINIEKIKTKIKNEKYLESLKKYNGKLLLVNISYNKLTKEHKCSKIDEIELTGN